MRAVGSPRVAHLVLLAGVVGLLVPKGGGAAGLEITPDKTTAKAGEEVTFTFYPPVATSQDYVDFNFGDMQKGKVTFNSGCLIFGGCTQIRHAYAGKGTYAVSAQGSINGEIVSGATQVVVAEDPLEGYLFVPTAAHLPGYQGTLWRTDLVVQNFGSESSRFDIAILPRTGANPDPEKVTITLEPQECTRYDDVLKTLFDYEGAAALQLRILDGTIIANSRTYNQTAVGTYGQYVPAFKRSEALTTLQYGRLIQLAHQPSSDSGFRTNLGLLNASPAAISVDVFLYDRLGSLLGSKSYTLGVFEYRQIDKVFEQVTPAAVDNGYIDVRTPTGGARFFAFASVIDNVTGDPTYVPAIPLLD